MALNDYLKGTYNFILVTASETRSAGETEEDDVKDEDWLPGSEELILETEEESPGTANRGGVVDSGLDTSKEEEDKMEEGEMEDEDVPAAADNDNSAFTGDVSCRNHL